MARERVSQLHQKGFVAVGFDGGFLIMRNAYGQVRKVIDDWMGRPDEPASRYAQAKAPTAQASGGTLEKPAKKTRYGIHRGRRQKRLTFRDYR